LHNQCQAWSEAKKKWPFNLKGHLLFPFAGIIQFKLCGYILRGAEAPHPKEKISFYFGFII
jgi:hypothetical protein